MPRTATHCGQPTPEKKMAIKRKYNFGLEQGTDAIPTAKLIFSVSPDRLPHRVAHCDAD